MASEPLQQSSPDNASSARPVISQNPSKQQKKRFAWTGFQRKTLWDWLELLAQLAIPVVIAAGTLWFTAAQSQASAMTSNQQHQTDLSIAKDQEQETILQNYLDKMSDLLLNYNLKASKPGDEVRNVARARTLAVLLLLNGNQRSSVLTFLYEAGLLQTGDQLVLDLSASYFADVSLEGANFTGLNLPASSLDKADLLYANFSYANFGSILHQAPDKSSILDVTALTNVDARSAHFEHTNLSDAFLVNSNFAGADLRYANLTNANLQGIDLSRANLTGAVGLTESQLNKAKSLHGAVMPDGSTHP